MGWVTKASGDRGIDFVGRLDLGTNVGPLRVVVAGQAKCQIGGSSPAELSRLAAKLSRGWVGVFITTGYFSQQAQMELQDDGYPILLIDGRRVGELVARECIQSGTSTREFLEQVDATYEVRVKARNASEILSDE
jgi:restriction endonuclease Mrr